MKRIFILGLLLFGVPAFAQSIDFDGQGTCSATASDGTDISWSCTGSVTPPPPPPPPSEVQCVDGIDNDGDGLIDRSDPGCSSPQDNDESDDNTPPPPPPPVLAQCEDGIDNDGDGLIDLTDPGCSSSTDDDETDVVDPPPPPPPPTGDGTIPEVPFDYLLLPDAVTDSGPFPSSMSAGTVWLLEGDTFVQDKSTFTCNGTEENPVFILDGTLSSSGDIFNIVGSYCYFVGTKFEGLQPRPQGHHMVFRNVEVANNNAKNGMNVNGQYIVLLDSEIHHNQPTGRDGHGLQVGSGANKIWILGNDFHHNSGNGIQACHGCESNRPSGIYIAGNQFHSDREVGIGLKYADDVIVENNVFYDIKAARPDVEWCFDDGSRCGIWNSGSDGSAVVIGADNDPELLTNVVIRNNEVYNTSNGFRVDESTGPLIEGNNIHDIDGSCLGLDKNGLNTVFKDNICKNAGRGIFQNWRDNFSLTIDANVFQNIGGPAVELEQSPVYNASTLTNNQFINTGAVIYGNTVATTADAINSLVGASGNTVQ